MCEAILRALAAGERLSAAEAEHLQGCDRCRGAAAILAAHTPITDLPPLPPVPDGRTLDRIVLRRAVVRTGAVAGLGAVLLAFLVLRPSPPPEPDLLAALDELEDLRFAEPPSYDALVLLDPYAGSIDDILETVFSDERSTP
jgi:hypothetical protein